MNANLPGPLSRPNRKARLIDKIYTHAQYIQQDDGNAMNIRDRSFTSGLAGLAGLALVAAAPSGFAADSDTTATQKPSQDQSQAQASNQSEGMYSADRLMSAQVYASGDSESAIGQISDVLLDNNMTIKSFVVETNGKFGMGGKSYVVSPDQLSVKTLQTEKASKPTYRVDLDMTRDALAAKPVYSDSWWSNAQSQASDTWQQTRESASSAWTRMKKATSDIVDGGNDKADKTGDAADNAADKTDNATN